MTDEEKAQIRGMLLAGRSHNSIARQIGRNQSTVSDYARREGITPVNRVPRKAIEARKHHALEDKLAYTNTLMEKVLEIGRSVTTGREAKEVSTAWGILCDKFLLLTGQPTSRSETHSTRSGALSGVNLEEELRKLDAMAAEHEAEIQRDNE